MNKKTVAILLAVSAGVLALVAGSQYKLQPAAKQVDLEGQVKVLAAKIETAKSQEASNDSKLRDAIDHELDQKPLPSKRAEELKENLKAKVGETSSMPALEEAAQKSKALETQVNAFQKESYAPEPSKWTDYNPKLLFSLLVCLAGLFIILRGNYSDATEKFAFSLISTVIGVWLGTLTS